MGVFVEGREVEVGAAGGGGWVGVDVTGGRSVVRVGDTGEEGSVN